MLGTSQAIAELSIGEFSTETVSVLVVSDAQHPHTSDGAVVLVQQNSVAIADAQHAHTVESLVVSQGTLLILVDAQHPHTADAYAISQDHTLVVADSQHAHTAANISIVQHGPAVIADSQHPHASDSIILTENKTVALAGSQHAHTSDAPSLTQNHIAASSDSQHAQVVDHISIIEHFAGVVADSGHLHTAATLAMVQDYKLVAADSGHAHTAATIASVQHHQLSLVDSQHPSTAGIPVTVQTHWLPPADASHIHTSTRLVLSDLTFGNVPSVQFQAAGEIVANLKTLGLKNVRASEIEYAKVAWDDLIHYRGYSVVFGGEVLGGGTTEREDIGYVFHIIRCYGTGKGRRDELEDITKNREFIVRHFSDRRRMGNVSSPGTNQTICKVVPGKIVMPRKYANNRDVDSVTVQAWFREPRGSR